MDINKKYLTHAETLSQNILGILIGFAIMRLFGVPTDVGVKMQVVLFVASYIRSYSVRSTFRKIEEKFKNEN